MANKYILANWAYLLVYVENRYFLRYILNTVGCPGGRVDDPYVKRKELAKSALLLGAGVLKGALITTLINNVSFKTSKKAKVS